MQWLRSVLVPLFVLCCVLGYAAKLPERHERVLSGSGGRDFASYHYAYKAAVAGHDPWKNRALATAHRKETGNLGRPHPFLYPPPFLLGMTWIGTQPLTTTYVRWFWIDMAMALGAVGVLGLGWRRLHPTVVPLCGLALLTLTAIPNNHVMGQVNHAVLLLTLLGLWAEGQRREVLGGVLLGMACMAKMSPALFVLWWLGRGRWRAVLAALATAVLLSVATLPWVSAPIQWRFYTQVLPGFATGAYNGLAIPVGLFGNHSLPNVLDQLWPGDGTLSGTAQWVSRFSSIATVLVLAGLFRRAPADGLARAGQIGAVGVAMLVLPVYTYEHHLVWAMPAMVAGVAALAARRLHLAWAVVLVPAWFVLAVDLHWLRMLAEGSSYGLVFQEAKFLGLLAFGAAAAWLGQSSPPLLHSSSAPVQDVSGPL